MSKCRWFFVTLLHTIYCAFTKFNTNFTRFSVVCKIHPPTTMTFFLLHFISFFYNKTINNKKNNNFYLFIFISSSTFFSTTHQIEDVKIEKKNELNVLSQQQRCCFANEIDILQLYLFLLLYIFRLDVHLVATHHYPKDSFHCEHCPKSYCYRPSLLRHRAVVHGEYRKYPCENCSKVSVRVFLPTSNSSFIYFNTIFFL